MYQSRNQLLDLQNYTFVSRYAQFLPDQHRRETYKEAVQRTKKQHETYFANLIKENARIQSVLDEAYESYEQQDILGSQRSLQFGGPAVLSHNARQYNCLKRNTKFITSEGIKSFEDYKNGDVIRVLTHTGQWQNATVRSYGQQSLYKIHFKRYSQNITVSATKNHRWILNDKTETSSLSVGDQVITSPNIFHAFNYDAAPWDEKLYWCYGFVMGDGTLCKDNGQYRRSMVRLCGDKNKYLYRFEEMGFENSSPLSCGGDAMVYTGHYLKTLPDPCRDDPRLIRAFINGLFCADGSINNNGGQSEYSGIQSSDPLVIDFLRKYSAIAGIHIIKEYNYSGQTTNFGIRPHTIRFSTVDSFASCFRVVSIEPDTTEEVWCLEVDNDHSFVLEGGLVTGNCSATYINRPRVFAETLYLLLCGVGVGFSVQKHHVAWLPAFRTTPKTKELEYVIEDSIEGWADALNVIVDCYLDTGKAHYDGVFPTFKYHKIRPKGSKFSHGVGRAPGPDGLRQSLERIVALLDRCLADGRSHLRPIDAYDIIMHASDAVLSGGVRRSATLCMFSPDDEDMMNAKTGDWYITNPQRARSNNSAVLLRGKTSKELFAKLIRRTKEFGEPGFIWVNSLEEVFNPCVEIGMYCYDTTQPEWKETPEYSGFQMCNLTTINGGRCTTKQKFFELVKRAAILGTFQAAYTNFPYLGRTTENIVRREALIGVSITGIMQMPSILLDPDTLSEGAKTVVATNKMVAGLLGINPSPRCCCIKPEGSSSSMIGTSSGCHRWHSKKFLRRVQVNKTEIPGQFYAFNNPQAVTESVWSATNSDNCITFACEAPEGSLVKTPHYAAEMLKHVRTLQKYWVWEGSDDSLSACPSVSHNVSNTINVDPDEWDDVTDIIFQYQDYYAGISLLGNTGDKDYDQAPFAEVKEISDIATEYNIPTESIENYQQVLTRVCELFVDPWKFENHIKGYVKFTSEDDERMSLVGIYQNDPRGLLILKELWLNRQYDILRREFCSVDYTLMYEEDNNTNATEESACAGGACIA